MSDIYKYNPGNRTVEKNVHVHCNARHNA